MVIEPWTDGRNFVQLTLMVAYVYLSGGSQIIDFSWAEANTLN